MERSGSKARLKPSRENIKSCSPAGCWSGMWASVGSGGPAHMASPVAALTGSLLGEPHSSASSPHPWHPRLPRIIAAHLVSLSQLHTRLLRGPLPVLPSLPLKFG